MLVDVSKTMEWDLTPLSVSEVASTVEANDNLLLIDTRSSGQYCAKHITSAENLTFSNIILRRILKGLVALESLIPSQDSFVKKLCNSGETPRYNVVIYDSSSAAGSVRSDLAKYAEVICKAGPVGHGYRKSIHFIDGGFAAFASQFPALCQSSPASTRRAVSPVSISVSASLPISFQRGQRQNMCLQTPQADDSYGPPVEILPHLVLGCEKDSANLALLRHMGITAILNVSSSCPNHFESLFEYLTIPVEDSYQADLLSKLNCAVAFIDGVKSKGGRVFLHCHAGISRSATVCIAYIMKHLAYDLAGAYDHVKGKRPRVSPNLHFMGQLVEFQRRLHCVSECETTSSMCDDISSTQTAPTCCLPDMSATPSATTSTSASVHDYSAHCTPHQSQQAIVPTRPNRLSLPSVCSKPQDGTTDAISALIAADVATSVASHQPGLQSFSAPASLMSLQGYKPTTPKPTEVSYAVKYPMLPSMHQHDSTSSVSLPTTPHSALKGHLHTHNSGSSVWINRHCLQALQLSPCRVVAASLDYRCTSIAMTTNN